MNSLSARRRHPLATLAVILLALVVTGGLYAVLSPQPTEAAVAQQQPDAQVQEGRELYLANCATCHGLNAEGSTDGPSLVGVGAAAVHFQVGTARMPAYTSEVQQVPQTKVVFSQDEIFAMAAYVATLGPGPAIPSEEDYSTEDLSPEEIALGGELFRTNCSMCHNAVGAGGALTTGKYAPTLFGVEPVFIYEAMVTGPQQMPVFGDYLPEDEKRMIIGYLEDLQEDPPYGGIGLGNIGPVTEGAFAWIVGIGGLIGFAVWLGQKAK